MASTTVVPGTRSTVELALRGRRVDVRGRAFQATLLLTLLLALGFLVVLLLWSTWQTAYPVFQERGLVRHEQPLRPARPRGRVAGDRRVAASSSASSP